MVGGVGGGIGVEALVVGRLKAGLDGVKRIDEKINCKGCEGTSK